MDLDRIPHEPGCYLFMDPGGGVIYVGKAKDLFKRVSSYFNRSGHDPKTQALVSNIASVDFIVTGNEKEAFLLENTLIKKHQPKYNIDLKDSKRYAYLVLTEEKYPRLLVARKKDQSGTYFGPFVSAEKRDVIRRFANNIFRLRTCRKMPKKPCLRYHMERCTAPCAGFASLDEYVGQARDARKFLSGNTKELLNDLGEKMKKASQSLDFEKAKVFRDRINALSALSEKQHVETGRSYDQDILDYVKTGEKVHMAVFNAYRGVLSNKDEFEFDYGEGFLEEFISRYYSENPVPREIIVPEEISAGLNSYLNDLRGSRAYVTVPRRGEKKELLLLVRKNIERSFLEPELRILDLQEKLGLKKPPRVIECFDISHTGGSESVGSMVRFSSGVPDKSQYRRFRIKSVDGIDDFAMIAEVVRRRYSRLIGEGKDLPDLVVIDGGKGQLSSAVAELKELEVVIPVISLAKKMEEVYLPGRPFPYRFDRRSRGVLLLQQVRDEAHRFAISYHRLLRKKRILGE